MYLLEIRTLGFCRCAAQGARNRKAGKQVGLSGRGLFAFWPGVVGICSWPYHHQVAYGHPARGGGPSGHGGRGP